MKDMDWKMWLLILALGLGGVFEILKHAPVKSAVEGSPWDLDLFRGGNSTPYNVRATRQARAHEVESAPVAAEPLKRQASPELQAFIDANTPQSMEFAHKDKGEEGKPEATKKADSEYEIVIDPETGKMYRKKKKRKKKSIKELAPEEPVVEAQTEEEPKQDDNNIEQALEEAIVTRNLQPPAGQKPKPYATLEEWVARLLNHPDLQETKRFIEAYRTNLVSADIFYKVVAMMIEDSRPDMKELGVLCTGMTPSVMSFQMLADIVRTIPTTESVRRYAENFVNQYADLSNLYILERILRAPNSSYSTILAAKKLEMSAQRYLSPEANRPSADPSSQNTGVHSNAGYFQRFVVILESLARSTDQDVASQANVTLTDLRTRLTPSGNAPTTPPPPTADDGSLPPTQASTQPL